MTIDSGFPRVETLRTLEVRTLGYILDCKVIVEESGFSDLRIKSNTYYNALRSSRKRAGYSHIDFQSHFDLNVGKGKRRFRFHFGTLIQDNYSQVTYYLAICEYNEDINKCSIRRKFHFDYDKGSGVRRQPHPKYHFQYGGGKPSGMGDHGDLYETVLSPQLSEPRLHYTPMSLALLLNCVFVEFSTEITVRISEDNIWRDIIKSNEIALLLPYYKKCMDFFTRGSHSPKKLFTSDFCYGK